MTQLAGKRKKFRCTEEYNAIDYLQRTFQFLQETESQPQAWKWVILALYGSLYSFALLACRGKDQDGVIVEGTGKTGTLISLTKALDLCQDTLWMNMILHSAALELTRSQQESLTALKNFLEENPGYCALCGDTIENIPLPHLVADVLEVITFLALETKAPQLLTATQSKRIKITLNKCKKLLKQYGT